MVATRQHQAVLGRFVGGVFISHIIIEVHTLQIRYIAIAIGCHIEQRDTGQGLAIEIDRSQGQHGIDAVGTSQRTIIECMEDDAFASAGMSERTDVVHIEFADEHGAEGIASYRVPVVPEIQVVLQQFASCLHAIVADGVIGRRDAVGRDRDDDIPVTGHLLGEVVVSGVTRDGFIAGSTGPGDAGPSRTWIVTGRMPTVQNENDREGTVAQVIRIVHRACHLHRFGEGRRIKGFIAEIIFCRCYRIGTGFSRIGCLSEQCNRPKQDEKQDPAHITSLKVREQCSVLPYAQSAPVRSCCLRIAHTPARHPLLSAPPTRHRDPPGIR